MRAFADIPEALANTVEIAKRCNVTVRLGEYFLPQFPTGDMSTEDYLVKRAKGLEERLAFYSLTRKNVLSVVRSMTNVWILNFRLSTRWASRVTSSSLWNLSSGRKITVYR